MSIIEYRQPIGRSSSIKPSCGKTKLNRCTTTEIRWNKNEDARTSPVVSNCGIGRANVYILPQIAQELKSIAVDYYY